MTHFSVSLFLHVRSRLIFKKNFDGRILCASSFQQDVVVHRRCRRRTMCNERGRVYFLIFFHLIALWSMCVPIGTSSINFKLCHATKGLLHKGLFIRALKENHAKKSDCNEEKKTRQRDWMCKPQFEHWFISEWLALPPSSTTAHCIPHMATVCDHLTCKKVYLNVTNAHWRATAHKKYIIIKSRLHHLPSSPTLVITINKTSNPLCYNRIHVF